MRILKTEIKGTLGINVEFSKLENVVKLSGKNGAGKSRIMDCILSALKYESLPIDTREALKETEGETTVEIGGDQTEWKIKRIHKDGNTRLIVKDKNGMIGGKANIDKFLGEFVNIGEIVSLKKEKLMQVIIRLLGLEDVIAEAKKSIENAEQLRRFKKQQAQKQSPGEKPEEVEHVDVEQLIQKRDEILKRNKNIETAKREVEKKFNKASRIDQEILSLNEQLEQIKGSIDRKKASAQNLRTIAHQENAGILETEDTTSIDEEISGVTEKNKKAQKFDEWKLKEIQYKQLLQEIEQSTKIINEKREAIKKTVSEKSASMGIPGLTFEDGLKMNGQKLISDGEIRNIAFQIAKKTKKDFAIGIFENFSLVDDEKQAEIIEQANEAGFQLFLEVVRSEPGEEKDEFFIENGKLK